MKNDLVMMSIYYFRL